MDIPSIPGAPLLAFTRDHALSMFSRDRICSNRSDCARPCFRPASIPVAPPVGFVAVRPEAGVATHPSSSDLPAKAMAVLCPLLTPARFPSTLSLMGSVQVSPDKNANSNCTTPPFTSRAEPGTSLCCANSSMRAALYVVSVRGLTVLHSGFLSTLPHGHAVAVG